MGSSKVWQAKPAPPPPPLRCCRGFTKPSLWVAAHVRAKWSDFHLQRHAGSVLGIWAKRSLLFTGKSGKALGKAKSCGAIMTLWDWKKETANEMAFLKLHRVLDVTFFLLPRGNKNMWTEQDVNRREKSRFMRAAGFWKYELYYCLFMVIHMLNR